MKDLQRALFGRERLFRRLLLQIRFRRLHLGGRLRQQLGDLLERRITIHLPARHFLRELVHLLAHLCLSQRQEDDVLAVFLGRDFGFVAQRVERAGDDFLLLARECADIAAAPAAAAGGLRLRLLVVFAELTDLDEVDVARRVLRSFDAVVVGRARVVRHDVARLETQLLEIQRVPRAHFRQRLRAAKELHRFLWSAVRRVHEL